MKARWRRIAHAQDRRRRQGRHPYSSRVQADNTAVIRQRAALTAISGGHRSGHRISPARNELDRRSRICRTRAGPRATGSDRIGQQHRSDNRQRSHTGCHENLHTALQCRRQRQRRFSIQKTEAGSVPNSAPQRKSVNNGLFICRFPMNPLQRQSVALRSQCTKLRQSKHGGFEQSTNVRPVRFGFAARHPAQVLSR